MKLIKIVWNCILIITIFAVFKSNEALKSTAILCFSKIKDLIVYLLNQLD